MLAGQLWPSDLLDFEIGNGFVDYLCTRAPDSTCHAHADTVSKVWHTYIVYVSPHSNLRTDISVKRCAACAVNRAVSLYALICTAAPVPFNRRVCVWSQRCGVICRLIKALSSQRLENFVMTCVQPRTFFKPVAAFQSTCHGSCSMALFWYLHHQFQLVSLLR